MADKRTLRHTSNRWGGFDVTLNGTLIGTLERTPYPTVVSTCWGFFPVSDHAEQHPAQILYTTIPREAMDMLRKGQGWSWEWADREFGPFAPSCRVDVGRLQAGLESLDEHLTEACRDHVRWV